MHISYLAGSTGKAGARVNIWSKRAINREHCCGWQTQTLDRGRRERLQIYSVLDRNTSITLEGKHGCVYTETLHGQQKPPVRSSGRHFEMCLQQAVENDFYIPVSKYVSSFFYSLFEPVCLCICVCPCVWMFLYFLHTPPKELLSTAVFGF